MGYSKAPITYYSTIHDSITSLCKSILPLGFKKKCLVSAEHRLWKLQSDNLKWQQDTFHQMTKLIGLYQEDILPEAEVSAFRTHLLDTLLASPPPQQDHPFILRDKLVFLQELLNAKCISEGEYHSSKRPLLLRLEAQGGYIEGREVMSNDSKQDSEEEWSVIDLKDDHSLMNKENSNSKKKSKQARKQIKGPTLKTIKGKKSIFESPFLHMHSAHSNIPPSTIYSKNELKKNPFWGGQEKLKRKPFRILFHKEKKEGHSGEDHQGLEAEKSPKKQCGYDGFKKWKKSDSDDETLPLSLIERSDSEAYLASYQLAEVSDTKLMRNKLHYEGSPYNLSTSDKVFGEKIKEELSIIHTNTNLKFSNDRIEATSIKLPKDNAELWNYSSKSLRDPCGDVVKKDHVGEMKNMSNVAEEKHENSMKWTTFEDDENLHPNLFVHQDNSLRSSSINPFSHGYAETKWK